MRKKIICEGCKQRIVFREEFVAALIIFYLKPYHEDCYARELRKYEAFFFNGLPINGNIWTLHAFLGAPIAFIILISASGGLKWLALVVAYPTIYRVLTYIFYERHLRE